MGLPSIFEVLRELCVLLATMSAALLGARSFTKHQRSKYRVLKALDGKQFHLACTIFISLSLAFGLRTVSVMSPREKVPLDERVQELEKLLRVRSTERGGKSETARVIRDSGDPIPRMPAQRETSQIAGTSLTIGMRIPSGPRTSTSGTADAGVATPPTTARPAKSILSSGTGGEPARRSEENFVTGGDRLLKEANESVQGEASLPKSPEPQTLAPAHPAPASVSFRPPPVACLVIGNPYTGYKGLALNGSGRWLFDGKDAGGEQTTIVPPDDLPVGLHEVVFRVEGPGGANECKREWTVNRLAHVEFPTVQQSKNVLAFWRHIPGLR